MVESAARRAGGRPRLEESHGGGIEQVGGDSRQARPSHHRLRRPPHRGDPGPLRLHPRRRRRAGRSRSTWRPSSRTGRTSRPRNGTTPASPPIPGGLRPPRTGLDRATRHDPPASSTSASTRAGPRLLRPLPLGWLDLPAVERRRGAARQLPGLQPVRRRHLRPLLVADDPGGGGPDAHAGGGPSRRWSSPSASSASRPP